MDQEANEHKQLSANAGERITTQAAGSGSSQQSGDGESQKTLVNLPSVLKHVDNYIVFNEKLGGGQFSQVYKAMDKNDKTHQKYFAVKVIPMSSAQYQKFANYNQLLQKEIEILLKARHGNLICMHDLKQTPNNLYLFLDYCNGGDLRQHLVKKKNRLAEEEAVEFFKQMCAGYQALHEKMIIHRDLKPENILLHDNQIKIGDFGFARIVSDLDQAVRMTQKCSPLYAPPQILLNEKYSSKCDVWSMGCIFFEMLYGKPPFNAHSIISLTENIKKLVGSGKYVLPSFPPVAQEAKDILLRMLMYSEKDRISWEEIFKHPILVKHLQKKLVENVLTEPNITPIYQSMKKNIDAVWENRLQQEKQQPIPPAIAQQTPLQIPNASTLQKVSPTQVPLQQTQPPPQDKSPQRPYAFTTQVTQPSTQGGTLFNTNNPAVPTTTTTTTTNPTTATMNPNSATTPTPTLQKAISSNEPLTPNNFQRHERRYSQASQTVVVTTTQQQQMQQQQQQQQHQQFQSQLSTRQTAEDRSPSPISTNPLTNNQTMKRAYSNNAREQVNQITSQKPFETTTNTLQNHSRLQQQQQHSPSTKRHSQPQEDKRREVVPISPNSRQQQQQMPNNQPNLKHYSSHAGQIVQQQHLQHQNSEGTSSSSYNNHSRRDTYGQKDSSSWRSPTKPSSPISSPLLKPAGTPMLTKNTSAPISSANQLAPWQPQHQQQQLHQTSQQQQQQLQQQQQQNSSQQSHSQSQLQNQNSSSSKEIHANLLAYASQKENIQNTIDPMSTLAHNLTTNSSNSNSQRYLSSATDIISQNQKQHHLPTEPSPSNSSNYASTNNSIPREQQIQHPGSQYHSLPSGHTATQALPSSGAAAAAATTTAATTTTQQSNNGSTNEVIQKIEQSKELSENEKYVLYMKQIKVREAERAFVSKIDTFFGFMRKRALFANATLLNFWNSTRQFNLPSYLQCAILYCLCSYYFHALESLRKILSKEIEQKVIKKDGFEVYQRSQEYLAMKDLITQDVSEAKQLFSDIEPFMISEIKLSTQPEALDFTKFINAKHTKHDNFRIKLQQVFSKTVPHLNTKSVDRTAAKGVHMVQIFANIEEFIPSKSYNDFDFNRFYDDRFNNLDLDNFIAAIHSFNEKYFQEK